MPDFSKTKNKIHRSTGTLIFWSPYLRIRARPESLLMRHKSKFFLIMDFSNLNSNQLVLQLKITTIRTNSLRNYFQPS